MIPNDKREQLLDELRRFNRTYTKVYSYPLAVAMSVPDRTIRHWLKLLESMGVVARPPGTQRSGWIVVN